jgi:hypothetical protein
MWMRRTDTQQMKRAVIAEIRFQADRRCRELAQQLAISEARRELLERELAVAHNHFEWARVRLNQVEAERAQLLSGLTKVEFTEPMIRLTPPPVSAFHPTGDDRPAGVGEPLGDGNLFEDVGDEEAHRLGLVHEDDGILRDVNGERQG